MRKLVFVLLSSISAVHAFAQSTNDDWDISKGTIVTNVSALNDPAPFHQDVRDAFGGTFGDYGPEIGNVVFNDETGDPGWVDFIEWKSPTALAITDYTMYWSDDFPDHNRRNLRNFNLYGRSSEGDGWTLLDSRITPLQVGVSSITGKLAGTPYQFWRAEFMRGPSDNIHVDGVRVKEIDGFVAPVPEPATIAALGLGSLAALRRRKRV